MSFLVASQCCNHHGNTTRVGKANKKLGHVRSAIQDNRHTCGPMCSSLHVNAESAETNSQNGIFKILHSEKDINKDRPFEIIKPVVHLRSLTKSLIRWTTSRHNLVLLFLTRPRASVLAGTRRGRPVRPTWPGAPRGEWGCGRMSSPVRTAPPSRHAG